MASSTYKLMPPSPIGPLTQSASVILSNKSTESRGTADLCQCGCRSWDQQRKDSITTLMDQWISECFDGKSPYSAGEYPFCCMREMRRAFFAAACMPIPEKHLIEKQFELHKDCERNPEGDRCPCKQGSYDAPFVKVSVDCPENCRCGNKDIVCDEEIFRMADLLFDAKINFTVGVFNRARYAREPRNSFEIFFEIMQMPPCFIKGLRELVDIRDFNTTIDDHFIDDLKNLNYQYGASTLRLYDRYKMSEVSSNRKTISHQCGYEGVEKSLEKERTPIEWSMQSVGMATFTGKTEYLVFFYPMVKEPYCHCYAMHRPCATVASKRQLADCLAQVKTTFPVAFLRKYVLGATCHDEEFWFRLLQRMPPCSVHRNENAIKGAANRKMRDLALNTLLCETLGNPQFIIKSLKAWMTDIKSKTQGKLHRFCYSFYDALAIAKRFVDDPVFKHGAADIKKFLNAREWERPELFSPLNDVMFAGFPSNCECSNRPVENTKLVDFMKFVTTCGEFNDKNGENLLNNLAELPMAPECMIAEVLHLRDNFVAVKGGERTKARTLLTDLVNLCAKGPKSVHSAVDMIRDEWAESFKKREVEKTCEMMRVINQCAHRGLVKIPDTLRKYALLPRSTEQPVVLGNHQLCNFRMMPCQHENELPITAHFRLRIALWINETCRTVSKEEFKEMVRFEATTPDELLAFAFDVITRVPECWLHGLARMCLERTAMPQLVMYIFCQIYLSLTEPRFFEHFFEPFVFDPEAMMMGKGQLDVIGSCISGFPLVQKQRPAIEQANGKALPFVNQSTAEQMTKQEQLEKTKQLIQCKCGCEREAHTKEAISQILYKKVMKNIDSTKVYYSAEYINKMSYCCKHALREFFLQHEVDKNMDIEKFVDDEFRRHQLCCGVSCKQIYAADPLVPKCGDEPYKPINNCATKDCKCKEEKGIVVSEKLLMGLARYLYDEGFRYLQLAPQTEKPRLIMYSVAHLFYWLELFPKCYIKELCTLQIKKITGIKLSHKLRELLEARPNPLGITGLRNYDDVELDSDAYIMFFPQKYIPQSGVPQVDAGFHQRIASEIPISADEILSVIGQFMPWNKDYPQTLCLNFIRRIPINILDAFAKASGILANYGKEEKKIPEDTDFNGCIRTLAIDALKSPGFVVSSLREWYRFGITRKTPGGLGFTEAINIASNKLLCDNSFVEISPELVQFLTAQEWRIPESYKMSNEVHFAAWPWYCDCQDPIEDYILEEIHEGLVKVYKESGTSEDELVKIRGRIDKIIKKCHPCILHRLWDFVVEPEYPKEVLMAFLDLIMPPEKNDIELLSANEIIHALHDIPPECYQQGFGTNNNLVDIMNKLTHFQEAIAKALILEKDGYKVIPDSVMDLLANNPQMAVKLQPIAMEAHPRKLPCDHESETPIDACLLLDVCLWLYSLLPESRSPFPLADTYNAFIRTPHCTLHPIIQVYENRKDAALKVAHLMEKSAAALRGENLCDNDDSTNKTTNKWISTKEGDTCACGCAESLDIRFETINSLREWMQLRCSESLHVIDDVPFCCTSPLRSIATHDYVQNIGDALPADALQTILRTCENHKLQNGRCRKCKSRKNPMTISSRLKPGAKGCDHDCHLCTRDIHMTPFRMQLQMETNLTALSKVAKKIFKNKLWSLKTGELRAPVHFIEIAQALNSYPFCVMRDVVRMAEEDLMMGGLEKLLSAYELYISARLTRDAGVDGSNKQSMPVYKDAARAIKTPVDETLPDHYGISNWMPCPCSGANGREKIDEFVLDDMAKWLYACGAYPKANKIKDVNWALRRAMIYSDKLCVLDGLRELQLAGYDVTLPYAKILLVHAMELLVPAITHDVDGKIMFVPNKFEKLPGWLTEPRKHVGDYPLEALLKSPAFFEIIAPEIKMRSMTDVDGVCDFLQIKPFIQHYDKLLGKCMSEADLKIEAEKFLAETLPSITATPLVVRAEDPNLKSRRDERESTKKRIGEKRTKRSEDPSNTRKNSSAESRDIGQGSSDSANESTHTAPVAATIVKNGAQSKSGHDSERKLSGSVKKGDGKKEEESSSPTFLPAPKIEVLPEPIPCDICSKSASQTIQPVKEAYYIVECYNTSAHHLNLHKDCFKKVFDNKKKKEIKTSGICPVDNCGILMKEIIEIEMGREMNKNLFLKWDEPSKKEAPVVVGKSKDRKKKRAESISGDRPSVEPEERDVPVVEVAKEQETPEKQTVASPEVEPEPAAQVAQVKYVERSQPKLPPPALSIVHADKAVRLERKSEKAVDKYAVAEDSPSSSKNKKQRQRNNNREIVNIIDMHGGSVAAAEGRTLYNQEGKRAKASSKDHQRPADLPSTSFQFQANSYEHFPNSRNSDAGSQSGTSAGFSNHQSPAYNHRVWNGRAGSTSSAHTPSNFAECYDPNYEGSTSNGADNIESDDDDSEPIEAMTAFEMARNVRQLWDRRILPFEKEVVLNSSNGAFPIEELRDTIGVICSLTPKEQELLQAYFQSEFNAAHFAAMSKYFTVSRQAGSLMCCRNKAASDFIKSEAVSLSGPVVGGRTTGGSREGSVPASDWKSKVGSPLRAANAWNSVAQPLSSNAVEMSTYGMPPSGTEVADLHRRYQEEIRLLRETHQRELIVLKARHEIDKMTLRDELAHQLQQSKSDDSIRSRVIVAGPGDDKLRKELEATKAQLAAEKKNRLLESAKYVVVSTDNAILLLEQCLTSASTLSSSEQKSELLKSISHFRNEFDRAKAEALKSKTALQGKNVDLKSLPPRPNVPAVEKLMEFVRTLTADIFIAREVDKVVPTVTRLIREATTTTNLPNEDAVRQQVIRIWKAAVEPVTAFDVANMIIEHFNLPVRLSRDSRNGTSADISDDPDQCAICLEELFNEMLPLSECRFCEKSLHTKCVEEWLVKEQTCPMCRVNWPSDEHFPPLH